LLGTYDEIRRVVDAAKAIKILFKHVAEVKARAEDTVLLGNRRIAEELRKVPKASGGSKIAGRRLLKNGRVHRGYARLDATPRPTD
jgi:hypothetical protein